MIVIIDLLGSGETVVVGGTDEVKLAEAEKLKREQALREIMERTPQPQVIPVESR